MLIAPRIIAIDDEPDHLRGLAEGLNQYGAACLQIHFTGDVAGLKACPHVRLIFADLHLNQGAGGDDHARHFGVIGSLIEQTITPAGPYVLVLWTKYPDQATALGTFLEERLQGVAKPFSVAALDKKDHLDLNGKLKDINLLVDAIVSIVRLNPQIGALLNWEERVLGAASDTVSSIINLATTMAEPGNRAVEVGRLLARLGVEAVGEDHVEHDRFQAVNEALLPILADRIAMLRSRDEDSDIWKSAFAEADVNGALSTQEAAKLNRLVHIASLAKDRASERGAVIDLPVELSGGKFESSFDLKEEIAAADQFQCSGFQEADARFQWVLVQSQAACDYAQMQPGTLPYYLGLELPEASRSKSGKSPQALWSSPPLDFDGKSRLLHVSARFPVSLPRALAAKANPRYRLREQLLNDLVFRIHSYGARPGIMSFHERKAKPQASVVGAQASQKKK